LVPMLAYVFGKEGVEDWKKKFGIILVCELVFFGFALIDLFSGGRLHAWGIRPRDFPGGLIGVLIAPFVHNDFTQFLVNAVPFAVLSGFVLMREDGITTWTFLSVLEVIVGGLCIWGFGRAEADHNGCAGLIIAYFGFLLLFGVFRREARAALIAIVVIVAYGGVIWTTVPNRDSKISWEGHLLGFLIGCVFGSWEGDIVQMKETMRATGQSAGGSGSGSGSGGANAGSGSSSKEPSEKAPLTSDDLAHDDDLHDSEVGAAAISGANKKTPN